MFNKQELLRYSRQIILPELGLEGQERLRNGSVLVIGAGGLGSPALLYLAAAGVGHIGIVEFDTVDESNLHRQILYSQKDIGKSKARLAKEKLEEQNPHIQIDVHECQLSSVNAMDIISKYSLVIDGSDNLPTRYLVNDACVLLSKALIYGAIFQFEGQVSVFNQPGADGKRGPNYRDLFPEPPPPEMVPSCAEGGVLGVLPGIIGSMQANEAIKILAGIGTSMSGRLMIFDALDFSTRFLRIRPNANNPLSGTNPSITQLIDYEAFCKGGDESAFETVEDISPAEVRKMMTEGLPFQFIDVREVHEYQMVNLGAVNIPLKSIKENVAAIQKKGLVVIHCKSGQRSRQAIHKLQTEFGFRNLKNMRGGLLGWRDEVDRELPVS